MSTSGESGERTVDPRIPEEAITALCEASGHDPSATLYRLTALAQLERVLPILQEAALLSKGVDRQRGELAEALENLVSYAENLPVNQCISWERQHGEDWRANIKQARAALAPTPDGDVGKTSAERGSSWPSHEAFLRDEARADAAQGAEE